MDIFPIGSVSAASNSGTIDSVSYSMFEPNAGCYSTTMHNVLTTLYETKVLLTRKKAEPIFMLNYEYNNIFSREYRQLEHFFYDKEGMLTSFYAVDFSKGQTPDSITDSSGDWVVAIDNTRLYSTVSNYKSDRAFIWDGKGQWKEGSITAISANTSVTVDVDTNNYGALSLARAQTEAYIYPIYQVYFQANSLDFRTGPHIEYNITLSGDGGYMYSGTVGFRGRYKI